MVLVTAPPSQVASLQDHRPTQNVGKQFLHKLQKKISHYGTGQNVKSTEKRNTIIIVNLILFELFSGPGILYNKSNNISYLFHFQLCLFL